MPASWLHRQQEFVGPARGGASVRRPRGFTLVEALIVIAVIAIFIALALPTFDRRRSGRSPAIACMNNARQLALGWMMYATDNLDALIANEPYVGTTAGPNNWVGGIMDWSSNPQNTNVAYLLTNQMGDYIKNAPVYLCPADKSVSAAGPRVRSYAMNAFMSGTSNRVARAGWQQCRKTSDIKTPTRMFVFLDEHANSIDDGYFFNDPGQTNAWMDLPAANHNEAAGFSFADGHAEIHKWGDRSTKQKVVVGGPKPVVNITPQAAALDLTWMLSRTTHRDTNSAGAP